MALVAQGAHLDDIGDLRFSKSFLALLQAALVHIHGDDAALALHCRGQRQCFSPAASAKIQHLHTALSAADMRDHLRSLVLDFNHSLSKGFGFRKISFVARAQAPGRIGRFVCRNAVLGERSLHFLARRDENIRAHIECCGMLHGLQFVGKTITEISTQRLFIISRAFHAHGFGHIGVLERFVLETFKKREFIGG